MERMEQLINSSQIQRVTSHGCPWGLSLLFFFNPIFHPASPPGISLFSCVPNSHFPVSCGPQGAQMKMELASLAPLQVPRVAVARERPGEALPTQSLYRKTTQLLETLYQLSANAKVVDMRQSKSSRSYRNVLLGFGGVVAPLCCPSAHSNAGWDPG